MPTHSVRIVIAVGVLLTALVAAPASAATTADLSITINDAPITSRVGSTITFHATVHNAGPSTATGVHADIHVAPGFDRTQLTSTQGSCTALSCTIGSLPAGGSVQITITRRGTTLGATHHEVWAISDQEDTGVNNYTSSLIVLETGPCTVVGTAGDDLLVGTAGPDYICGIGGRDKITGLDGNDILDGGTEADQLDGGNGTDVLLGWPANDKLTGGAGDDILDGGEGVDTADYGKAPSAVQVNLATGSSNSSGGAGVDVFLFEPLLPTIENVIGTAKYGDTISGEAGKNRLTGGGGNDTINATQGGKDQLVGGAGDDVLNATDGGIGDLLNGGAAIDVCTGDATDTYRDCP